MPDMFPQWEPRIKAALAGKPPFSVELDRMGPDGKQITIKASYAPIVDDGGEIIGASIAVADLTARACTEEVGPSRLQQYRRFRKHSPSSPWLADADFNIIELCPLWFELTGMTQEECDGKGWLKPLHPDDFNLYERLVADALEARRPYEVTFRLRSKTGAWRWMRSVGSPMFGETGDLIGWCGYTSDLAEEKLDAERKIATLGDPASAGRSGELTVH
jgi:PAS domain S-box-containing protein